MGGHKQRSKFKLTHKSRQDNLLFHIDVYINISLGGIFLGFKPRHESKCTLRYPPAVWKHFHQIFNIRQITKGSSSNDAKCFHHCLPWEVVYFQPVKVASATVLFLCLFFCLFWVFFANTNSAQPSLTRPCGRMLLMLLLLELPLRFLQCNQSPLRTES